MSSLNSVTLMGNLVVKPELRVLASGKSVTTLRLATNESWVGKDGKKQNSVCYHTCVVWGKSAESCAQYLDKGRQILVEGRISNRKFTDKEGVVRYVSEVVTSRVQFIGSKPQTTPEEVVTSEEHHEQLSIQDVDF
jgi:single-strand DNA-binding protein